MHGRLWQICQGKDVDAGTAEQYRQLWLAQAEGREVPISAITTKCPHLGDPVLEAGEKKKRKCGHCGPGVERQVFNCNHPAVAPEEVTVEDCHKCEYGPRPEGRHIVLKNHLSPGDVLVMTAAIRSLHKAHPGKFSVSVDTTANAVFEHSPDIRPSAECQETIEMHYPAIHACNDRGITFMQGYCEFLSEVLQIPIPLLTNRPHVWLSKQERTWMDQVQETIGKKQKFWLVQCGRKNDFTTKFWGTQNFQRVIDSLRGKVLFVQVGAAEHHHPPLKNVMNLTGKTDLRQLIRLAWHAEGIVCGVTFLQHLAAALQKPSIVILGGREPIQWNTYPKQTLLHTVGMLPCCYNGGCWRSRVEKLNDGAEQDGSLCENPVIGEEAIPKCMALISPEEVVEKVLLVHSLR